MGTSKTVDELTDVERAAVPVCYGTWVSESLKEHIPDGLTLVDADALEELKEAMPDEIIGGDV